MNVLTHLLLPRSVLSRRFPSHALTAIERAIEQSETLHRAEIRFAIEVALELRTLWRVRTPRERAIEVFSDLQLWDTAEQNGVLIYVLLAEHDVEIVADRGFNDRVTHEEWQHVCNAMERAFGERHWVDGALDGIELATRLLVREFPASGENPNEHVNRPALL